MPETVAYRYVADGEVAVIRASTPQVVPKQNAEGKPKIIYFTWDLYTSASVAEVALQIGTFHPGVATDIPTDRLDLDVSGISYIFTGTVPGGTGTQLTTYDSPLVTAITVLGP